jgi:hypothetical protein
LIDSKTRHIIVGGVSVCMLFALGCGLLGLSIQQRVITPADMTMQFGPFSIIAHGPRPSVCPEKADPLTNVCDRFSAFPAPASYRIWVFWNTPERGARPARVLAHWVLPLRDPARN